ncbi:MAG: fumarylacetoacetate hydrolase family protein [Cryobacterium sp.]|uniref:fumarylacetoacetate hydrolase family protein n=1 Tax=unclassified Cryobacterium TaxID=2649013 RepID=UPI0018C95A2C|nr:MULTISPECIES: fumarylacetoacetate hydrolase family protein [unclassified Cryobacterium]MCY7403447.1 fumarylacetoacetate hydrolase family protein [Cryobacterium sp.]MEC5152752.1 2-keto-4-pentenoate hydratase/2-oxohepta-3-ene-1,7-dioic acid hydratase in catechol pathway [Cryobacterium sp. CAN_C3]
MKIARFSHEGAIAFGIVDDDELVVLTNDPMFAGFDTTGDRVALADVKLLAPVIPRSKIVAVMSSSAEPVFVLKPNTTVVGPGDAIVLPSASDRVEVDGQLAIIIGKVAKNVSATDAPSRVFGYTIATVVTAADLADGDPTRAGAYDTFCPLGPIIETDFDEAATPLSGLINDEEFQAVELGSDNATPTEETVAALVAFASSVFTLLPGDVILAGPMDTAAAIVAGDTITMSIAGIGTLVNPVVRLA